MKKAKAYEWQKAHRVRQHERGLKQVLVWIPADQAEEIKLTAKQMRQAHFDKWGKK